MQGRGETLATITVDPAAPYRYGLSPSGSQMAVVKARVNEGRIRLVSAGRRRGAGNQREELDRFELAGLGAGRKRIVCDQPIAGWAGPVARGSERECARAVEAKGHVETWSWTIPSPDGKHLAILGEAVSSNAWMTEGL